jgi:indolepyruvate ferredoxin oxidoreductase
MGGEGASWLGIAPFTETAHVFQNLGDGTYAHSGSLSIRAAVAAQRNMTFRILYNEATAMTGGQPIEGGLSVAQIVRQVAAEGVARIVVITDEPGKYAAEINWRGRIRPPRRTDFIQRELREWRGVSAIVYDRFAPPKRRRRKRDPRVATAIARSSIRVCEDAALWRPFNCASMPMKRRPGRKRVIDRSCNVDKSCITAFCPSIVTVEGVNCAAAPAAIVEIALPPPQAAGRYYRRWNYAPG